ncbi:MAG: c-type cytochrome [Candidatus Xenobia bacterium]
MKKWFASFLIAASLALVCVPVHADPADVAAGKALFHKNCVACHGIHGDGKGPAAAGLSPAPANFTDKAFMSTQKDTDLQRIILNGFQGSAMASWRGKLSDQQVAQLISYIRSLSH